MTELTEEHKYECLCIIEPINISFLSFFLTQEVTLSNAIIPNELLYQTMRLEHLAHLRLTNCDDMTLSFHEGVLPVLTLRGHNLISLLLANFTVVDLVGE